MTARLVLHHTYDRGRAFDVSESGNHGRTSATSAGTGGFTGSLGFDGQSSRVQVDPSPSFATMRELTVKVRFWLADQPPGLRNNLVEAHVSFALVVDGNRSVAGTIVDAAGAWTGVASPAGAVSLEAWHTVEFHHDGISRARLWLDGTLVAERFDVAGPLRDMGGFGLAIGQWPDTAQYTLRGWLDDVAIWRDDPADDVADLVDPCCADRARLDDLVQHIRAAGWNAEQLGQLVEEMRATGTEIARAARGGDPAQAAVLTQLSDTAWGALAAGDRTGFARSFADLQAFLATRIPAADLADFATRAYHTARTSPVADLLWDRRGRRVRPAWIRELAGALCLGGVLPTGPLEGEGGPPPPVPLLAGDPDTDAPPDTTPPDPADASDPGATPAHPDDTGGPR
jgi:hypothetical protein